MALSIFEDSLERIVVTTYQKLQAQGFRRRGATIRAIAHGNAALIEFQKSAKSSRECIEFTVNLGVICGELLDQDQSSIAAAKIVDAHVRRRIGEFLPGRPDKWWVLNDRTDINAVAAEISDLITSQGAPYLLGLLEIGELIALWETGESPGLTEIQRVKYLKELRLVGEW